MSWFTDIFSGGIGDIVKGGVELIDELHTSDEEKEQAKLKLATLMQSFEEKALAASVDFEKQITERHANDMKSDSWLSKNIRPLSLAVTGGIIYTLVYFTVFSNLSENQINVLSMWIPMLTGLFTTMVVFYFGSRGIEKFKKMSIK